MLKFMGIICWSLPFNTGISSGDIQQLVTLQQQVLSKVNSFDQRLTKVEGVIANSFSELKKLMENEARKNFTVKDSGL